MDKYRQHVKFSILNHIISDILQLMHATSRGFISSVAMHSVMQNVVRSITLNSCKTNPQTLPHSIHLSIREQHKFCVAHKISVQYWRQGAIRIVCSAQGMQSWFFIYWKN
jgi:hypothetical protein